MPGSDPEEIPHLPEHNFPILPDTMQPKFEHGESCRRCKTKRTQVPIELMFAITYPQGTGANDNTVDLAGCAGTEPPSVIVSRATCLSESIF